jgi:hypothetical protein
MSLWGLQFSSYFSSLFGRALQWIATSGDLPLIFLDHAVGSEDPSRLMEVSESEI